MNFWIYFNFWEKNSENKENFYSRSKQENETFQLRDPRTRTNCALGRMVRPGLLTIADSRSVTEQTRTDHSRPWISGKVCLDYFVLQLLIKDLKEKKSMWTPLKSKFSRLHNLTFLTKLSIVLMKISLMKGLYLLFLGINIGFNTGDTDDKNSEIRVI